MQGGYVQLAGPTVRPGGAGPESFPPYVLLGPQEPFFAGTKSIQALVQTYSSSTT
jgi:hypothetical protein